MPSRNNILAGLFLILALALAVWMSFMLSERSAYQKGLPFVVRFSLADGAAGLKNGSPVLLGGQQVGQVSTVKFQRGPAPGAGTGGSGGEVATAIDVAVEVDASITLFENAQIYLELPLLGTLSSINIAAVGDPTKVPSFQGQTPAIERGEVIGAGVAPPGFLKQAGFGPEQTSQIQETVRGVRDTATKVSALIDRNAPKIDGGVEDVRAIADKLRKDLDAWATRLETILKNAQDASAKLEPILAKAEGSVDDARALIADVRATVNDNRAKIDSIIANAESVSAKLNTKTVDELNAALADARKAMTEIAGAADTIGETVTAETPNVKRILANLRLMADNLKLTAVEVRSQPWRLLVQPTTKEFESQVLYDSTRAYAEAASDLRAATESLQSVLASGPASAELKTPDGQTLAQLTERLAQSAAKYKDAEQRLLDTLIEKKR